MRMPSDAFRSLIDVRWRLLETYALARQEGLNEPIGLVADTACPYARQVVQQLLLAPEVSPFGSKFVTCMERAMLISAFKGVSPEISNALETCTDQPGCWVAVLLQDRGLVLWGTWQELITSPTAPARKSLARAENERRDRVQTYLKKPRGAS